MYINLGRHTIEDGKLGDIAPTILDIMGMEIPKEMTVEARHILLTSSINGSSTIRCRIWRTLLKQLHIHIVFILSPNS